MSVNCWWHIGQLSVAYQSCVNLAGESSGFRFERLSNVIMLLGKMLQCEAWLLYEANRRALWTKGMVIFSFVPIVSSVGQVSAKCRPSVGQVSAKCRQGIGDLKSYVDRHTSRPTINWLSTEYRPRLDWVSFDCRSTVDRVAVEYRSSVDRYVDQYSGRYSGRTLPTVNMIRMDYELSFFVNLVHWTSAVNIFV